MILLSDLLDKTIMQRITKRIILTLIYFSFCNFLDAQENKKSDFFSKLESHFKQGIVEKNRHSIGFSIATNYFPLTISPTSSVIKTTPNFKFFPRHNSFFLKSAYFDYGFHLAKNIFVECGIGYVNNYSSATIDLSSFGQTNEFSYYVSAFNTYSLDLGAGYKVVVKNKVRLFDLRFGMHLSILDGQLRSFNPTELTSIFSNSSGQQLSFTMTESDNIVKNIAVGTYLGVSKDISLTKNLFLNLRYNKYFGKNMILSRHVFSYQIPDLNIDNSVDGAISSAGQMYSLGLHWVFN